MNLKSAIQAAMLVAGVMSLAACAGMHRQQQNSPANVYSPATSTSAASGEINMNDQANATMMSTTGKPVKTTASLKQIQQAAKNGNPDAEYALGYMYYYGQKVPQNNEAARAWIQKAAAQGQPQAMTALKMIEAAQKQQHPAAAMVETHHSAPVVKPAAMNQTKPVAASKQPVAAQQKTTHSMAHAANNATTSVIQQGEANLKRQPSNHYTLQLLGSYSKKQIVDIITKNNLAGDPNINAYRTKFNGRNWYVLTYGLFNTAAQAQQDIANLPESIQRLKPWVDSIGNIKQRISHASVTA